MTESTIDINLLDEDPDVGDLEHVLTTAGNLEQAAGVGDGLFGVAHVGVFPVSEPLGTEIKCYHVLLQVKSSPLTECCPYPPQHMYSRWRVSHLYLTQLSVSYLVSSGITSAFRNPIWMSTNNLKHKPVS